VKQEVGEAGQLPVWWDSFSGECVKTLREMDLLGNLALSS
jgi:hypothetical protein